MPDILTITEDKRLIDGILEMFAHGASWQVGRHGVTEIVAYEDYGLGAMVPWFAVYVNGEMLFRVPSHSVVVRYETGGNGE